jgi:hypothetical protein
MRDYVKSRPAKVGEKLRTPLASSWCMPGASIWRFSGPRIEKEPRETKFAYEQRTQTTWGLMEWVADTCTRF